jgi:hypothetical protein
MPPHEAGPFIFRRARYIAAQKSIKGLTLPREGEPDRRG